MVIHSIAPTSYNGMYKIVPEEGSAFFIRPQYLSTVDFDSVQPQVEFNEEEMDELLDAGLASVVELKAVDYLARESRVVLVLPESLFKKNTKKNILIWPWIILKEKTI